MSENRRDVVTRQDSLLRANMHLTSRVPLPDWHCELKNRTLGVRVDESQFSPVVFDHGKTNSEPQSHTARLCGKERIEDASSIVGGNSGSGVLHRQPYGRVTVETRREPQTSRFRSYGAHSFDSVLDKIQEYLLELRAIQMHVGKVALKLCGDGYFVNLKIVLLQSQH